MPTRASLFPRPFPGAFEHEELEGGRAVGGREDLVTGLAEQGGQQTSTGQGIIDDQNAHRWSASEQVLCQPPPVGNLTICRVRGSGFSRQIGNDVRLSVLV